MTDFVFDAEAVSQGREFILGRAHELEGELGFGYRASELAPSTYAELLAEHAACRLSGLPVRVSSFNNDTTVFGPDVNLAYRFWHDCEHVRLRADFSHGGEVIVAGQQMHEFERSGVRPYSPAWKLLFVETFGYTECNRLLGVFPEDQRQFAADYLEHRLPEAIRREGMRRSILPIDQRSAEIVPLPATSHRTSDKCRRQVRRRRMGDAA